MVASQRRDNKNGEVMILEIRPLAAGNALRITLKLPAGAALSRLLRKPTNNIVDEADSDALVAYQGTDTVITDAEPGLVNNQPTWYEAFYYVPGGIPVWQRSGSMSGTPVAAYADASTDVQSLLRERMEKGLAVEVARGTFKPGPSGAIAVLTAPPIAEETDWPVVTVQLDNESTGERAIGELLQVDFLDPVADEWVESEGYLAEVRCVVAAWCTNPDERIELRKALRRLVVTNFTVFDAAGFVEISMQASDAEFLNGEFGPVNVFQTSLVFSCKAPVVVHEQYQKVLDVVTEPIPVFN